MGKPGGTIGNGRRDRVETSEDSELRTETTTYRDADGDGVVDATIRRVATRVDRDGDGRREALDTVTETDLDADGTVDVTDHVVESWDWDPVVYLHETWENLPDHDGDGRPDGYRHRRREDLDGDRHYDRDMTEEQVTGPDGTTTTVVHDLDGDGVPEIDIVSHQAPPPPQIEVEIRPAGDGTTLLEPYEPAKLDDLFEDAPVPLDDAPATDEDISYSIGPQTPSLEGSDADDAEGGITQVDVGFTL